MTKLIQLKLVKIKYSGDSIGDDIRMKVECLNQFFSMDKKIQHDTEIKLNAEIGQFTVDQASSLLPINIRIIEQDLVFNDVGAKQVEIKIDTRNTSPQTNTYDISVKELRGLLPGRATAIFSVAIQAQISDAMLYVAYESTKGGWLNARPENGGKDIGLPAYLKVRSEKHDAGRHYFQVLEGAMRGTKASVKIKADNTSYFQTENPHTGSARLTYSLSQKRLTFRGKTYATRDYKKDTLTKGRYDIEIPDHPHAGGEYYLRWAKLAKVWFRVGHDETRYIHLGTFSLGCVTLIERDRWDDLCKVLMKARKGDGVSIGVLEVIE